MEQIGKAVVNADSCWLGIGFEIPAEIVQYRHMFFHRILVLPILVCMTCCATGEQVRRKEVVKFTSVACTKVREFQEKDGGKYLRVAVLPQGPTGFMYNISFVDSIDREKDFLSEQEGVNIIVDQEHAAYLLGATIDWRTDAEGNQGFHFDNPNAL